MSTEKPPPVDFVGWFCDKFRCCFSDENEFHSCSSSPSSSINSLSPVVLTSLPASAPHISPTLGSDYVEKDARPAKWHRHKYSNGDKKSAKKDEDKKREGEDLKDEEEVVGMTNLKYILKLNEVDGSVKEEGERKGGEGQRR